MTVGLFWKDQKEKLKEKESRVAQDVQAWKLIWAQTFSSNFYQDDHIKIIFFSKASFTLTSHSAYYATSTKSNGVKIDGFLYTNLM